MFFFSPLISIFYFKKLVKIILVRSSFTWNTSWSCSFPGSSLLSPIPSLWMLNLSSPLWIPLSPFLRFPHQPLIVLPDEFPPPVISLLDLHVFLESLCSSSCFLMMPHHWLCPPLPSRNFMWSQTSQPLIHLPLHFLRLQSCQRFLSVFPIRFVQIQLAVLEWS